MAWSKLHDALLFSSLDGIVLSPVADENVGIQPEHGAKADVCFVRSRRRRWGHHVCERNLIPGRSDHPLKAEVGVLGRITTLPSGKQKLVTLHVHHEQDKWL
jgi:hypothetical protein